VKESGADPLSNAYKANFVSKLLSSLGTFRLWRNRLLRVDLWPLGHDISKQTAAVPSWP
jgi:hypothetical protein